MNKTTKSLLKWTIGIFVMVLLCWNLYQQIRMQLASGAVFEWWPRETVAYFIGVLLLLPVNIGIESRKWQLMINTTVNASFFQSVKSVLGGIAASVVTPNRIGEYPGRILTLKEPNSTRLISVSVLGACAQILSLMIAGIAGLIYYSILHPQSISFLILVATAGFTVALSLAYFSFEFWAPFIERFRFFKKLKMWVRLLHRFTRREQITILIFSVCRLFVFSMQLWLLLRWQGVQLSAGPGILLSALFFWAMAIIPSVALAELGIRGTVALYLFKAYTSNVAGITLAVFMLWCINLVFPALLGTAILLASKKK